MDPFSSSTIWFVSTRDNTKERKHKQKKCVDHEDDDGSDESNNDTISVAQHEVVAICNHNQPTIQPLPPVVVETNPTRFLSLHVQHNQQ